MDIILFQGRVGDQVSTGGRGMGLLDLNEGLLQRRVEEDHGELWDQAGQTQGQQ